MTRANQQLTVPVKIAERGPGKYEYRRTHWAKAIEALWREAKKRKAKNFVPLPIPTQIERGWVESAHGVEFRCLVAWVMFPLDGDPPGWRGRVDLAWTDR